MIWFHIILLSGTILLWIIWRFGWIDIKYWKDKKIRTQMLLLMIVGSILGLALTIQENQKKILTEEEKKIRKEENILIKEYDVLVDGKKETIEVQVPVSPSKAEEEQHEKNETEEKQKTMKEEIQDAVKEFNDEDADYYKLPSYVKGRQIIWMYPGQNTGIIVSGLFLILAIGMIVLQKQKEQMIKEERKEALLRDYPGMITKMALLLQAGMTVRMSIHRIAEDYKKVREKGMIRPGYEELLLTCMEIDSGISEITAYENLGIRSEEIRYKTLSTLLIQSLRKGTNTMELQLEHEARDAFEERKRTARVLGEKASTRLLFPMVLMLMVVLGLIMVPAILSFNGGLT